MSTPDFAPGIHKLEVPVYDAIDAARSSDLKTLVQKSPLHLRAKQDGDNDPTAAMVLGTATHMAVLEPARYLEEVTVFPGATRRGKMWDAFAAENEGRLVITMAEWEKVAAMRDAIRADPLASSYLVRGQPEMTLLWDDPATGLRCKARVDWLDTVGAEPILVGLKTARGSGPEAFARQAADLLYHLSWAHYRAGYRAITGIWPETVEIVVESVPPYDVVVYRPSELTIGAGEQLQQQALATLQECRRTGVWPGQGRGEVHDLELRPWALGMPKDEGLDWTGTESAA